MVFGVGNNGEREKVDTIDDGTATVGGLVKVDGVTVQGLGEKPFSDAFSSNKRAKDATRIKEKGHWIITS